MEKGGRNSIWAMCFAIGAGRRPVRFAHSSFLHVCLRSDVSPYPTCDSLSSSLLTTCLTTARYLTRVRTSQYMMFDWFLTFAAGGVVIWSRSFTPAAAQVAASSASPVNSLIREALIEGRNADDKYEKDGYAVKWTFFNDLELIFVVRHLLLVTLFLAPDIVSNRLPGSVYSS